MIDQSIIIFDVMTKTPPLMGRSSCGLDVESMKTMIP